MRRKVTDDNIPNKDDPWLQYPFRWSVLQGRYVNTCPHCRTLKQVLSVVVSVIFGLLLLWLLSGCITTPAGDRNNEGGPIMCLDVGMPEREICIQVVIPDEIPQEQDDAAS